MSFEPNPNAGAQKKEQSRIDLIVSKDQIALKCQIMWVKRGQKQRKI